VQLGKIIQQTTV